MTLIRTSDIQLGMELASDVLDEHGRLMLKAGISVSPRELRLLKMWGVAELDVTTPGNEAGSSDPAPLDPAVSAEYAPAARDLFRHADLAHPVTAQLFQECVVRLARRGCPGGGNVS
jgi:hypothetical protein